MKQKYKYVNVRHNLLFPGRIRVQEHRLVMAESLGRSLLTTEHVHHKDEDTVNNIKKNLKVMSPKQHAAHHLKGRPGNRKGKHHTVATRRKMSLNGGNFKGKHHTIETRRKMSCSQKDRHHTPETKRRMSLVRKYYWLQQRFPGL